MPKKMLRYEESLMLAGELVPINITLTRRRSFTIIVRTDKTVEVKAPLKSNIRQLLQRTADRQEWILKHRRRFEALPTTHKKQYINGEEFGYLGKKYKLNAIKASVAKVELSGDNINVYSKTASPAATKTVLKFWYAENARQIFAQRLPICQQLCAPLKLPPVKELVTKLMRRRWGSCATSRIITLNPELIAAPLECIDYVIVHELCHLKQHNHSPFFYALMTEVLPNWRQLKDNLNKTTEIRFL